MLSFISNIAHGYIQSRAMRAQSRDYELQAKLTRINGQAQKNAAESAAAAQDTAAAANARIANSNLRTLQHNKRAAEGSARAAQGASGFTAEGSGSQNAKDAQAYFNATIANAAQDASIASVTAYRNAMATRRQGEIAAMGADLQATQYDRAASQAMRTSHSIAAHTGFGAAVGLATGIIGFNRGSSTAELYNNTYGLRAGDEGYQNPTITGLLAGGSAATWGYSLANMLNPYTAGMTRGQNWGSNMSILMGNTPGIPDNRYSLSGLTGTKA